jgi:hypothetical protein
MNREKLTKEDEQNIKINSLYAMIDDLEDRIFELETWRKRHTKKDMVNNNG